MGGCFWGTVREVEAVNYYQFDVEPWFFSRWCYSIGECNIDNPPPGQTFDSLAENYDKILFLVSLQGLVNRSSQSLLLTATSVDREIPGELKRLNLWPEGLTEIKLNNLDEIINTFANNSEIKGSVVWDGTKPFTQNLALTIAGADNLVVIRKDSTIFSKVVSKFPVKSDLTGRFNTKEEGYTWLVNDYLKTGKVNPIGINLDDGWAIYKYKYMNPPRVFSSSKEALGWNLMIRDLGISRKAFFFDLAVNPTWKDPIENVMGKDENVVNIILGELQRLSNGKIFEMWGWPPAKYIYDCNSVQCGEWYWVERLSKIGGVVRVGGVEGYTREPASTSFYQHGKMKETVLLQPVPLTTKELLRRNYAEGYPLNYSFEKGGENWTIDTSVQEIRDNASQEATDGKRYLRIKIASGEKDKGFYQDISISLLNGYRYRFDLNLSSPEGKTVSGRQAVWGLVDNNWSLLCLNQFSSNQNSYKDISCGFNNDKAGISKIRLQVFLDSAEVTAAFDEAVLWGPNSLKINPGKKFLTLYQGDDDVFTVPITIRLNGNWKESLNSTLPVAWGMTTELSRNLPSLGDYFVKTKPVNQTWVMPDSGTGYANSGLMPDNYLVQWMKETAFYQRKFQYRSGWDLEGSNSGTTATSDKIANYAKVVAPEGIFYASGEGGTNTIRNGEAIMAMADLSGGGDSVESRAILINDMTRRMQESGSRFLALRNVFVSVPFLEQVTDKSKAMGGDYEIVGPTDFFYLYKLSQSQGEPVHRLTVVGSSIPSEMEPGKTYAVTVKVRNDGRAIWQPEQIGQGGDYKLAFGWQKYEDFNPAGLGKFPIFPYNFRGNISGIVMPGESIDVPINLTAPSSDGDYFWQFDGVKENYEFFETNGNVPWIKEVKVVSGGPSCQVCSNGKDKSNGDANCDGKVDLVDFGMWKAGKMEADFDCDSNVTIKDFGKWKEGFRAGR